MRTSSIRGSLYRGARLLGDFHAASRGPGALGKRLVRKRVYRATNKGLWRLIKKAGLG